MQLSEQEKIVILLIGLPIQLAIFGLMFNSGIDAYWLPAIILLCILIPTLFLLVEKILILIEKFVEEFVELVSIIIFILVSLWERLTNSYKAIKAVYSTAVGIFHNPISVTLSALLYSGKLILAVFLKKLRSKSRIVEVKLPGVRLLVFAKYVCPKKAYNLSFTPAVADWQFDYFDIIEKNTVTFLPKYGNEMNQKDKHKFYRLLTEEGKLEINRLNRDYKWIFVKLIAEHNIISSTIRYFYLVAVGK